MVDVHLSAGDREKTDELCARVTELARRTRQPLARGLAAFVDALQSTMDGQLEEALSNVGRAVGVMAETGLGGDFAAVADFNISQQPRRYLGRLVDRAAIPRAVQPSARILTFLAQPDPALRAELDQIAAECETITPPADEGYAFFDAALLQAGTIEHHEAVARRFTARYRESPHVTHGIQSPVCTARLLGDAAAILAENASARQHYEQARDDATRMRIRPEWALATLGLAEILEPGEDAQTYLDQAIAELQAMKMQPALERALARKELLKA
jgi:hypothetical protein